VAGSDKGDLIMISGRQKLIKAVALFLVCSLLQLYTGLSLAGPDEATAENAPSPRAQQNVGRLSTRGNKAILVNGNKADTGATILDGALLETTDCVTATVNIGAISQVDLATNTIATINYSDDKVKVTLKQGCVIVRADQAVNITIETPDGIQTPAVQPDASNRKRVEVCYPSGIKSDFTPSCIGAPLIIGGTIVGAVALLGALTIGGSSTACARGENSSLTAPPDSFDQCQ
jgi:hypothetical protein